MKSSKIGGRKINRLSDEALLNKISSVENSGGRHSRYYKHLVQEWCARTGKNALDILGGRRVLSKEAEMQRLKYNYIIEQRKKLSASGVFNDKQIKFISTREPEFINYIVNRVDKYKEKLAKNKDLEISVTDNTIRIAKITKPKVHKFKEEGGEKNNGKRKRNK